jgi:hypothetical protein
MKINYYAIMLFAVLLSGCNDPAIRTGKVVKEIKYNYQIWDHLYEKINVYHIKSDHDEIVIGGFESKHDFDPVNEGDEVEFIVNLKDRVARVHEEKGYVDGQYVLTTKGYNIFRLTDLKKI